AIEARLDPARVGREELARFFGRRELGPDLAAQSQRIDADDVGLLAERQRPDHAGVGLLLPGAEQRVDRQGGVAAERVPLLSLPGVIVALAGGLLFPVARRALLGPEVSDGLLDRAVHLL